MASDDMVRGWLRSAFQDDSVRSTFENLVKTTRENDSTPSSDVVMSMLADSVDRIMNKQREAGKPEAVIPPMFITPSANTNVSNNTDTRGRHATMDDGPEYISKDAVNLIAPIDEHYEEKEDLITRLCLKMGVPQSRVPPDVVTDDPCGDCISNIKLAPNITERFEEPQFCPLYPELQIDDDSNSRPDDQDHVEDTPVCFSIKALKRSLAQDRVFLSEDAGESSSDDEFLSVTDSVQERPSVMLATLRQDEDNLSADDEYESASDDEDLQTCYSREGHLSRSASRDFIPAENISEETKLPKWKFVREPRTIRPQFMGSLYAKKLAHAQETAAELRARKPEPRVKNERPVKLDTDLMYAVRRGLKRSLPSISATRNLSALMVMAEGIYDEMSLDRELDDLAWPYDPLKELKESGLALEDYMDPMPTILPIAKQPFEIVEAPRNTAKTFKSYVTDHKPNISLKILAPLRSIFNQENTQNTPAMTSYLGKYLRNVFTSPSVPAPEITLLPEANTKNLPMIPGSSESVQQFNVEIAEMALQNAEDKMQASKALLPADDHIILPKPMHHLSSNGRRIRSQFLSEFYLKSIQNARAQAMKAEPEPSVPKHLNEQIVVGKENSPAFHSMTEIMRDEGKFDQQVDEVMWPIDPLEDLKKSGLWRIDYMDSTDTDGVPSYNLEQPSDVTDFIDQQEEFYDADDDLDFRVIEAEDEELENTTDVDLEQAVSAKSNESVGVSVSEDQLMAELADDSEIDQSGCDDLEVITGSLDSALGSSEGQNATPPSATPEESRECVAEEWQTRVPLFEAALHKGEDGSCSDSALGTEKSDSTLHEEEGDTHGDAPSPIEDTAVSEASSLNEEMNTDDVARCEETQEPENSQIRQDELVEQDGGVKSRVRHFEYLATQNQGNSIQIIEASNGQSHHVIM